MCWQYSALLSSGLLFSINLEGYMASPLWYPSNSLSNQSVLFQSEPLIKGLDPLQGKNKKTKMCNFNRNKKNRAITPRGRVPPPRRSCRKEDTFPNMSSSSTFWLFYFLSSVFKVALKRPASDDKNVSQSFFSTTVSTVAALQVYKNRLEKKKIHFNKSCQCLLVA